jgi:hypothetical protein
MATEQRIYKVVSNDKAYLVQAISQAQALRHIAGRMYQVEAARPIDVATLMSNGIKLEVASTIPEQDQLKLEGAQA